MPSLGGHDLEQAVLPLRCGSLARRRPVPAARRPQRGPQPHLAPSQGVRRHLHVRQMGISLVCGLRSGLPLRRVVAGGCRFRQGSDRTGAAGKLSSPQRPDSRLRMGVRRCQFAERLVDIYRRDANGRTPAFPADSLFQHDLHWQDLLQFYEYFHGDTGLGLLGRAVRLVHRHGGGTDFHCRWSSHSVCCTPW